MLHCPLLACHVPCTCHVVVLAPNKSHAPASLAPCRRWSGRRCRPLPATSCCEHSCGVRVCVYGGIYLLLRCCMAHARAQAVGQQTSRPPATTSPFPSSSLLSSAAGGHGYTLRLECTQLLLALGSSALYNPSARGQLGQHPFLDALMQQRDLANPSECRRVPPNRAAGHRVNAVGRRSVVRSQSLARLWGAVLTRVEPHHHV